MVLDTKQQDQAVPSRAVKLHKKPKSKVFTRRWVGVDEIASLLGLAPYTIYKMIRRKQIKAIHIGRTIRVDLLKLDRQLEGDSKQ
jgi:excisionase family DNA binding protein